MKLGIIVQARIGSSRLPGKIVLPFHQEQTILDIILKKLTDVFSGNIVLATSKDPQNDVLEHIANKYRIQTYRGSENDVLSRFVEVCKQNEFTHALRICADNPFLDKPGIEALISAWQTNPEEDYIAYFFGGKPSILTHWGLWGEIVSYKALLVANEVDSPFYHEHVTNYIYSNPSHFSIKKIVPPAYTQGKENIRLTVDTMEDFKLAQKLFDWENDAETLIKKITREKNILREMEENIQKNTK